MTKFNFNIIFKNNIKYELESCKYPPQQPEEPNFHVVLPYFTFHTINTWLLSTWTFPPDQRYLRNLNVSYLRDAPLFIWKLPAGVRIRESIKAAREEFIKKMYVAIDRSQTTAAAATFIKKIDAWILELRTYAKTCPCLKPRSRKASELMIKHRSANLTYRNALERFGREPRMENLPPVRAALKELYILKHIE